MEDVKQLKLTVKKQDKRIDELEGRLTALENAASDNDSMKNEDAYDHEDSVNDPKDEADAQAEIKDNAKDEEDDDEDDVVDEK